MDNGNMSNWFVSTSQLDGMDIITRGRRDLKSIIQTGLYNDRIEIEWEYKPLASGMPTEESEKFMTRVAFQLHEELEKAKVAYMTSTYLGRASFCIIFITNTLTEFSFSLNDPLSQYAISQLIGISVAQLLKQKIEREFE